MVPGFLLKAVILENDLSEADVVVELGREIRIGDKIKIPIDARGYLTVFSGLKERLPSFGADILLWDEESVATGSGIGAGLKAEERAALEKRVVLIGYDDEKARTIPFKGDEKISRAELFSLAVATIQSGRYIRKVASWMQYAVWAVIAVLGALVLRAKRGRAVMGSLVLLMAFFIAGMIQFQMNQSWMPLVIPMGLIACVFLCGLVLCQGKPKVVEEE